MMHIKQITLVNSLETAAGIIFIIMIFVLGNSLNPLEPQEVGSKRWEVGLPCCTDPCLKCEGSPLWKSHELQGSAPKGDQREGILGKILLHRLFPRK